MSDPNRTFPPGKEPDFSLDDANWRQQAPNPDPTAGVPPDLKAFAQTLRKKPPGWWNPFKQPQKGEPLDPKPLTHFEHSEWLKELNTIEDLKSKNLDHLQSEYERHATDFLRVYNKDVISESLTTEGLGDLVKDMEKKYAKLAAYFLGLEEDGESIADEDDNKLYEEIVRAVGAIRIFQLQTLQNQNQQQGKEKESAQGSNDGAISETGSEAIISTNAKKRERIVLATFRALREYVNNTENAKWQQEHEAISEGDKLKEAIVFRCYLINQITDQDMSDDLERQFAEVLEIMGPEGISDLIAAWTKKYEGEAETPVTEDIAFTLQMLLNRFKKQPQTSEEHVASTRVTASLERDEATPLMRPAPQMTPSSDQTTINQSNHPSAVPPTSRNNFTHEDRASGNPPAVDLTSHENPLSGFASVQQQPSTAVQMQMMATLKSMQDNFTAQTSQIADKLKSHQSSGSGSRKPPELWVFDGNPLNFQEWWDRFVSIYHNFGKMDNSEKKVHLDEYIGVKARMKCWPEGTTDIEYHQMVDKIKNVFNDKEDLLNLCLDKIINQRVPNDENDITNIRQLVITTRKMMKKLQRLEIPEIAYGATTMIHFMEKMDLKMQRDICKELKFEKFNKIPLKDLIDHLDDVCKISEHTTDFLEHKTKRKEPQRDFTMITHQTTMAGVSRQRFNEKQGYGRCIFCNNNSGHDGHKWKNCPVVTNPQERWNKFRELKLCLACGRNDHFIKDCRSQNSCGEARPPCSAKHHQSLHEYYSGNGHGQRDNLRQRSRSPGANRRVRFDEDNNREDGNSQPTGNPRAGR